MKNLVISIIESAIVGGIIYGLGKLMVLVGLIENGAPYWVCFIGAIIFFFIWGWRHNSSSNEKRAEQYIKDCFAKIPQKCKSSYTEHAVLLICQNGKLRANQVYMYLATKISQDDEDNKIIFAMMGYVSAYLLKDIPSTKMACNNCLDIWEIKKYNDTYKMCFPEYSFMLKDDNIKNLLFDEKGERIK